MANKKVEMKKPNIDAAMTYYQQIWKEKCRNAGVTDSSISYFDCIVNEIKDADRKGNVQKLQCKKIELLSITLAACNTIATALITCTGVLGSIFNIIAIVMSALVTAVASYNACRKPKETWLRHRANILMLDIETTCFCNGIFDYQGKNDSEAIKLYQERTAIIKLTNYENFFTNMGYVNFHGSSSACNTVAKGNLSNNGNSNP